MRIICISMPPQEHRITSIQLRDLANGLQQQMFFWGKDVVHPSGNFFVQQGFKRSASVGLKGTSCYRLPWEGGVIELYGSCAGWYGPEGGFVFIRPRRLCTMWDSSSVTPIPGVWQKEHIRKSMSPSEVYRAALPFLNWLISYEYVVQKHLGAAHRQNGHRLYKNLPKSKIWLPPQLALEWFECLCNTPQDLIRPKLMMKEALSNA